MVGDRCYLSDVCGGAGIQHPQAGKGWFGRYFVCTVRSGRYDVPRYCAGAGSGLDDDGQHLFGWYAGNILNYGGYQIAGGFRPEIAEVCRLCYRYADHRGYCGYLYDGYFVHAGCQPGHQRSGADAEHWQAAVLSGSLDASGHFAAADIAQ